MTSNIFDHSLGRHLLSCTRCLYMNLNLSLLTFAVATLYLTITAYANLSPKLMLYYKYEPINVMVITGCAGILVIASLIGIYSLIARFFHGFVINAIILTLLIAGTTGYTIWRGVVNDYTKEGKLFIQLGHDRDHEVHEELFDTMQRTLSCCGVEGFQEWITEIPQSCCSEMKDVVNPVCNKDNLLLNKKGCFGSLTEMLKYYNWIILISIGLLNTVQTAVATLSYMLSRTVQSKRKEDTLEELQPKSQPESKPEPEPETAPEPAPELEATPQPEAETENIPAPPPLPE